MQIEGGPPEIGSITSEHDFRLMLYRHWNVYDSMHYSNYVGTRLGIWKSARRNFKQGSHHNNSNNHSNQKTNEKISDIIAQLGIPILEAQRDFRVMDTEFKNKLKNKLHEIVAGPHFGLDEILFESFLI